MSHLYFIAAFAIILVILFSPKPETPVIYIQKVFSIPHTDSIGIFVPPDEYSHSLYPMKNLNWKELHSNKPGLLPGPRFGESLGLDCNPRLTLKTPIVAPISN